MSTVLVVRLKILWATSVTVVDLEDRMSVVSPEGVVVDYQLAGVGTRLTAILIDAALLLLVSVLVGVAAIVIFNNSLVVVALAIILVFVAAFGYPIGCDMWADGTTLGKRAMKIQVRMASGHPVTFPASTIRTLLGIVDVWLTCCAALLVSVLSTKKNQRLGDLAAGTIVVRVVVRRRTSVVSSVVPSAVTQQSEDGTVRAFDWSSSGQLLLQGASFPPGLDLSRITSQDVVIVRRFLERRYTLPPHTRLRLEEDYAQRLAPLVSGAPKLSSGEFLTLIVTGKDAGL